MRILGWTVLRDEDGELSLHTLKYVREPFCDTGELYMFTGTQIEGGTIEEAIRLFTVWIKQAGLEIVAWTI